MLGNYWVRLCLYNCMPLSFYGWDFLVSHSSKWNGFRRDVEERQACPTSLFFLAPAATLPRRSRSDASLLSTSCLVSRRRFLIYDLAAFVSPRSVAFCSFSSPLLASWARELATCARRFTCADSVHYAALITDTWSFLRVIASLALPFVPSLAQWFHCLSRWWNDDLLPLLRVLALYLFFAGAWTSFLSESQGKQMETKSVLQRNFFVCPFF